MKNCISNIKTRCKIDLKRLFFIASLALFVIQGNVVISQEIHNPNVFRIQQLGVKYSESLIHESLLRADWCQSINPTSNYNLTFDDGAIVKVISSKELKTQNINIEESCIRFKDLEDNFRYSISNEGYIVRFVSRIPAKTVIEN